MESKLTTGELIELIGVTTANINSQFELWLTVTFAVIVASHLAGRKLSKNFQHLIASLYVSVSILLFLMLWQAIRDLRYMVGDTMEWWSVDPMRLSIVFLRTGVWILGTLATLIFVYKGNQRADDA